MKTNFIQCDTGRTKHEGGADMRALVVEDEILTAMCLEDQLDAFGIASVGIAADRAGAIRLSADKPDIAFVDMNLRDGPTGTAIARHLVGLGVLVFYVTANPSQLGADRCLALAVIDKPCLEADLRHALSLIPPR